MKPIGRLKERGRHKARERHVAERERQKELQGRDTEEAIKDSSLGAGVAGQGAVSSW
jgi:hypothetical protein